MPLPAEARGRRRLLAIWSAISTSVVLAVIVFMIVQPGWSVASIGVEVVIVLFALEALARKQLAHFALLVVVFIAVAVAVFVVAARLVESWQLTLAAVLACAAVVLLALNVRELLRD
jgi:hypothetical protein